MISSRNTNISGGGEVKVFDKSTDERLYLAIVTLNNQKYPLSGVGINYKQTEGIIVIEGHLTITYDGQTLELNKLEAFYFEEGHSYIVEGTGKAVVAITPATGGKTELIGK